METGDERRKRLNREKSRRYRERHSEKAKASTRASVQKWRDADPLAARAYKDAWNALNPDRYRDHYIASAENRRARKLDAFVEKVDPAIVWDRDAGICHICKTGADRNCWHLEHVVPLSKGGKHSYANTAVSHPECNRRKAARLPEDV